MNNLYIFYLLNNLVEDVDDCKKEFISKLCKSK
jgi:hypothetical protein